MILAAGRGERMRPLTDTVPKPLLSVGGKPLIFWHLEKLAAAGFHNIVINHAHLGEQIHTACGDGRRWQVQIRYSPEMQALETAGGIAKALPLLGQATFAVVNADIYSEYDYGNLIKASARMQERQSTAHLVLVDNPPHHPEGDFALVDGLARVGEEHRLTFSGMGVYRASVFESVTPGSRQALAPLLRQQMACGQVTGEHFGGMWADVGTPQRLAELNALLEQRYRS